jgi:glycosyltransferase involved in cell wall biosynthesis
MRHICYLTGMFSRDDSLIFQRQGRSMVEMGYRVSYVVCDLLPDETVDGIELISCNFKPKSRLERMRKTGKLLLQKALALNADIYQISEPELIGVGLKLKKAGKSVLYQMREYSSADLRHKAYMNRFLRVPASWALEAFMKHGFRRFDAIFSVTPELVEVVKSKWKIAHSYLLTNFPRVDARFSLSFKEYLERGDVMVYFGTIYSTSRQETMFAALEKMPEVQYLVAGILGVDAEYITELPYWNRVEFINGFRRERLPEILARASISNVLRDDSVSGTPNGSLGVLKIFESMEAGLPILCSDVPVNKGILDDYPCGLAVDANDPEAVYKALRYLVDNKEKAYEMGQEGRRAVVEKYNWENQFKTYIDVIQTLG